jgi:hypothetical protein
LKGEERRRNQAWGAALGAPPPPVQCNATPMTVVGCIRPARRSWGGTVLLCLVTVWQWPRAAVKKVATGAIGVHHHTQGGAPPMAPPCVFGGTAIKIQSGGNWPGHRRGHRRPEGGALPFLSSDWCFRWVGRVVTTTLGAMRPPPIRCPPGQSN